jgi:DnaJ family protein C protein 11
LSDIEDNVASQVLDVTIPLNFLVTEAGQLKVCFTHTADKRKLCM